MSLLTENIAFVWLLPVLFQIILPLVMFLFYGVFQVGYLLGSRDKKRVYKVQSEDGRQQADGVLANA